MALATLTFGIASLAQDSQLFFIISALARVLQGVADAAVSVTIPGIITLVYPEKQEIYLGYFNMSIGIGTCAGPILGSFIYEYFGYEMTFMCFAVLIFIAFVISVIILPNKLN